jgi:hypothetical protein
VDSEAAVTLLADISTPCVAQLLRKIRFSELSTTESVIAALAPDPPDANFGLDQFQHRSKFEGVGFSQKLAVGNPLL